jgi:hypothetical protein
MRHGIASLSSHARLTSYLLTAPAAMTSSQQQPSCRAPSSLQRQRDRASSVLRSLRSATAFRRHMAATWSWQQTRTSTSCMSAMCTRSTG